MVREHAIMDGRAFDAMLTAAEQAHLVDYSSMLSHRATCCAGLPGGGGCPRKIHAIGHLELDHEANVIDSLVELADARAQVTCSLAAPWNTGLPDGGARSLHRFFAPEPHPEWGGGLTLRCGWASLGRDDAEGTQCHDSCSHAFTSREGRSLASIAHGMAQARQMQKADVERRKESYAEAEAEALAAWDTEEAAEEDQRIAENQRCRQSYQQRKKQRRV